MILVSVRYPEDCMGVEMSTSSLEGGRLCRLISS